MQEFSMYNKCECVVSFNENERVACLECCDRQRSVRGFEKTLGDQISQTPLFADAPEEEVKEATKILEHHVMSILFSKYSLVNSFN